MSLTSLNVNNSNILKISQEQGNNEDTIMTQKATTHEIKLAKSVGSIADNNGSLEWFDGYYNINSGNEVSGTDYTRTSIFPKNYINRISNIDLVYIIYYWQGSTYAGCYYEGKYHLPDGTESAEPIEFDSFALCVANSEKNKAYIQLKTDANSVSINKALSMSYPINNEGQLEWTYGYYSTSSGNKINSDQNYYRTGIFDKYFYDRISNKDQVHSMHFWLKDIYMGYYYNNAYHYPGTQVVSENPLEFDSFALVVTASKYPDITSTIKIETGDSLDKYSNYLDSNKVSLDIYTYCTREYFYAESDQGEPGELKGNKNFNCITIETSKLVTNRLIIRCGASGFGWTRWCFAKLNDDTLVRLQNYIVESYSKYAVVVIPVDEVKELLISYYNKFVDDTYMPDIEAFIYYDFNENSGPSPVSDSDENPQLIDIVTNSVPDRYYSSGGTLGVSSSYTAVAVDLTNLRFRRFYIRCGYTEINSGELHYDLNWVGYCFVKRSDNSYLSLSSCIASKKYADYWEVEVPEDSVELNLSYSKPNAYWDIDKSAMLCGIPYIQSTAVSNSLSYLDYDYLCVVGYGQSLGKGWAHNIITNITKYASNELMFGDTHKLPNRTDTTHSKLVPLVETMADNDANGETSESKALDTVIDLSIENRQPLSSLPKFIAFNMAVGGASITAQEKGSAAYTNVINEVIATKAYCDSIGKTFAVAAITWTQGESNLPEEHSAMPKATYKQKMIKMIADFNIDIKAITGQSQNVKLICYQVPTLRTNNGDYQIQDAFVELAKETKDIIFASAIYDSTWVDFYHIDAVSTCKMGCRYGAALFGILNNKKYIGIIPEIVQTANNGTEVFVTFDVPYPPLKLTSITGVDNYGFSIKNQSNNEIITNVSVYSDCMLKITCSEDARGLTLNYAKNSGHNAGYSGAIVGIGGLGDSMDDIVSFEDSNNTNHSVNNLAPIFGIEI